MSKLDIGCECCAGIVINDMVININDMVLHREAVPLWVPLVLVQEREGIGRHG